MPPGAAAITVSVVAMVANNATPRPSIDSARVAAAGERLMASRGVGGGTCAGIMTPPAGSDNQRAFDSAGGGAPVAVDGAMAVPATAPGSSDRAPRGTCGRTVPGGSAGPAAIPGARGGAADVGGAGSLGGRAWPRGRARAGSKGTTGIRSCAPDSKRAATARSIPCVVDFG